MDSRPKPRRLSLLIAEVDGTLVDANKVLTERAAAAVRALRQKGVHFAVTSGRPPRGMAMLGTPLALDTGIAGFNGGVFVEPMEKSHCPLTAAGNGDTFPDDGSAAPKLPLTELLFGT